MSSAAVNPNPPGLVGREVGVGSVWVGRIQQLVFNGSIFMEMSLFASHSKDRLVLCRACVERQVESIPLRYLVCLLG